MKFEQLELKKESNWFKRTIQSQRTRKTFIYSAIGAIGGLVYFFITEGQQFELIIAKDIIKSMLFGGFLGFIIANSPCAKNKC